jgi:hypothetical protein
MALGLVLGVAGLTSLDAVRCSIIPARASRIVETYRKAPEVGFLSRIALSLSEPQAKPAPRDKT